MDPVTKDFLHQAISEGGSGNAAVVGDLESAFAALYKAPYALCTSSGTGALICALQAVGVRPGDAVAVSALGPSMTGLAILAVGARPVFLDVNDPTSFGISPSSVQRLTSQRVKAVVMVPMWGYWDEQRETLEAIRDQGIPLIVDAAQAPLLQLRAGLAATADVICLSLHARKPFKAGEGGVCVCTSPALAEAIIGVRNFGQGARQHEGRLTASGPFAQTVGANFKINALGAAWCLSQVSRPDLIQNKLAAARESVRGYVNTAGIAWQEATQAKDVLTHGGYGLVALCAGRSQARQLADSVAGATGQVSDTTRYQYQPMYTAPAFARYATPCPQAQALTERAVAWRLEPFAENPSKEAAR